MGTITITITEQEQRAFEVAKNFIDNAYADNMLMDEEFGDDHYAQTHRHLDALDEKLQRKWAEKKWMDDVIAHVKTDRPDLSAATIRAYAKRLKKANII